MRCFVKRLARCTAGITLVCATTPALAQCPPDGWTLATLTQLKSEKWTLPDATQRQTLALGLLACLDQADPVLRDGLAFEALSTFLRNKQLTPATQRAIYRSQIDRLSPSAVDPSGFAKPFAALVLSEIARADRLMAFLSQEERTALLDTGTRYMDAIDDYRGFSSTQGWRHAVAHSADLMLQIALHPATNKTQLERMALSVQRKVAPPGEHFYVYGEPDRLVRPLIYAARRGLLDSAFWSAYVVV